ncbi:MAG: GTPase activating protein sec2-like protein [Caudoviricetes sp.]|nr:MAG: GTPase activating protein sec2-like protein [Caudoviricetes sp.]
MDIKRIYGYDGKTNSTPTDNGKVEISKKISRQIGGMKAQGVTSVEVEYAGGVIDIPKMSYVELLEAQVKELRNQVQLYEKQLIKTNNRLQRLENKITHENNIRSMSYEKNNTRY